VRKALFVGIALLALAGAALAADDAAAVRKADQDWAKSAASNNVDQFLSFFAPDAHAVAADGKWLDGQAVRDTWSKMLTSPGFKLTWTVQDAGASKDLGYSRGTFEGMANGKPLKGAYSTVWQKRGGKWKVIVDLAAPEPAP
jgi:ketosteroid isomerase-like protein